MPDLSLKGLDETLMRAVRKAALESDLTQRDFVIAALAKAVGWEKRAKAVAIPELEDVIVTQVEVKHPADCRCAECRPVISSRMPKCPRCDGKFKDWGNDLLCENNHKYSKAELKVSL